MTLLEAKLRSAVTAYDKRQSKRRGYNIYALPQYLARVSEVIADIEAGAPVRKAITAGFTGRLLDACLKAAGEAISTDAEQRGGWVYTPVTPGKKPPKPAHYCTKEQCKHAYCLVCTKCKYGCTRGAK